MYRYKCIDINVDINVSILMYRFTIYCIVLYTVYLGLRGGLWVYKKPKKDTKIFKDL